MQKMSSCDVEHPRRKGRLRYCLFYGLQHRILSIFASHRPWESLKPVCHSFARDPDGSAHLVNGSHGALCHPGSSLVSAASALKITRAHARRCSSPGQGPFPCFTRLNIDTVPYLRKLDRSSYTACITLSNCSNRAQPSAAQTAQSNTDEATR